MYKNKKSIVVPFTLIAFFMTVCFATTVFADESEEEPHKVFPDYVAEFNS